MKLTRRQDGEAAGTLARMRARARGAALDDALLRGADPGGSAALRARAALLTSRPHREALAGGIDRMLESLDGHGPRARLIPHRAVLHANAPALRSIAATLRAPAPVYAPGVALVHALLTDGRGPTYGGDAAALAGALEEARAALAGSGRVTTILMPRRGAARVRGGTPATRLSEALAMSSDPTVYRRHEAA